MDSQTKGLLKMSVLSILQQLGLHIYTTALMNKKDSRFLNQYIGMAYGSLLNIGSLYRSIEPTPIINEPFEHEYRQVFTMCKACKNFKFKLGTNKRYECDECFNFKKIKMPESIKMIRKDILNCENFSSDIINIIDMDINKNDTGRTKSS